MRLRVLTDQECCGQQFAIGSVQRSTSILFDCRIATEEIQITLMSDTRNGSPAWRASKKKGDCGCQQKYPPVTAITRLWLYECCNNSYPFRALIGELTFPIGLCYSRLCSKFYAQDIIIP